MFGSKSITPIVASMFLLLVLPGCPSDISGENNETDGGGAELRSPPGAEGDTSPTDGGDDSDEAEPDTAGDAVEEGDTAKGDTSADAKGDDSDAVGADTDTGECDIDEDCQSIGPAATCDDGMCTCTAQCDSKTCGADGCGGVCGECGCTDDCGDEANCVSELAGVWEGKYTCEQGVTGLTLTIEGSSDSLEAVFDFYPVDENPDVPSGKFTMSGSMDCDRKYDLNPVEWLEQPDNFLMVGLEGTYDPDKSVITGNITDGNNCEPFEIERKQSE